MQLTQVTNLTPSFVQTPKNNKKKQPNYEKLTGYAAAVSIGVGYAAGKLKKSHKIPALLAVVFTALHIGLLQMYKLKK